jgi:hypothetical protein
MNWDKKRKNEQISGNQTDQNEDSSSNKQQRRSSSPKSKTSHTEKKPEPKNTKNLTFHVGGVQAQENTESTNPTRISEKSITEVIPGSVKINTKILSCGSIPRGQGGGVSSNEGSIFLLSIVESFLNEFKNSQAKNCYIETMKMLANQKHGRKSFTHKDNTTLFNLTKAKTTFPDLNTKLHEFFEEHDYISFPILINFALGLKQGYFKFDESHQLIVNPDISTSTTKKTSPSIDTALKVEEKDSAGIIIHTTDQFELPNHDFDENRQGIFIRTNSPHQLDRSPEISSTALSSSVVTTPNQFKAQIGHLINKNDTDFNQNDQEVTIFSNINNNK